MEGIEDLVVSCTRSGLLCQHMAVILALRRLRQEDSEFEATWTTE